MRKIFIFIFLVPFLSVSCIHYSIPEGRSISGNIYTHDPSAIYDNNTGEYKIFYTSNGIGSIKSTDGYSWKFDISIFTKGTKPDWWKFYVPQKTDFNIWAPEVVYNNGFFWVYYSVSTFGSQQSCIGLVKSKSLDGPWEDEGVVVYSDYSTPYNAIDPGVTLDGNGGYYLTFGSWFGGIYLIELDNTSMKPLEGASATQIADRDISNNAIEGSYIWKAENGYYYLFTAFDLCCRGSASTYNIRYGRAELPEGPYTDKKGIPLIDGGGTILLQTDEEVIGPGGPGLFIDSDGNPVFSYFYYNGGKNGRATLALCDIGFSRDDWIILE